MKRKLWKISAWIIGILLGLVLLLFIAFQVSPRPGALIINHMFAAEVQIKDKPAYALAKNNTTVKSNRKYPSKFKQNDYDIYYPKNIKKPIPVIIWLHGGGYVGGDKSGMKEFATRMASDAKVAVVAMNYEHAPASQYPNQVHQVDELIQTLRKDKAKDTQLDLSRIFFGGDSAGSQIALQYATIQTNNSYAKQMDMKQLIPSGHIKGTISYCGPVDLKQTALQHSKSRFMKFFVTTVAWSLIGTKDWKESDKLQEASLVAHVNKDFPPTYITDGNAYSFQEQGHALADRLKELDVPVAQLFYTSSKKEITHEYQFDYATKEAKKCYQETLQFVNRYKK